MIVTLYRSIRAQLASLKIRLANCVLSGSEDCIIIRQEITTLRDGLDAIESLLWETKGK